MIDMSRMTDRSRKVLKIAETEARRRGAAAVFPEHVLLGLLLEGAGVAANVLRYQDVTVHAMESLFPPPDPKAADFTQPLPFDSSVEPVVERAFEEATVLNHNYIGTEHLILGVVFVGGDSVAKILDHFHIKPDEILCEVYSLLGHGHRLCKLKPQ
jgi:ATP-dependent Clp protease ATP-binding subunit ClpC